MKLHIIYEFKEGPWGGGNQFLKALRNAFLSWGDYTDNPADAEVLLLNSYQYIPEAARLRRKFPDKLFVHRIDGPMRLYNSPRDKRDSVTNTASLLIADGTVYQSEWSRRQNYDLGFRPGGFEIVIPNAPDPTVFNPHGKAPFTRDRKIRLAADSWSANLNKGFGVFKWLDDHLDFQRHEMTFIGKSPCTFRNIRHIAPLPGNELAAELKKHDIFIFASRIEACSNTLLEALHCGLPVVGINTSSTPELIGRGGLTFDTPDQIPGRIKTITDNYSAFQSSIRTLSIDQIAEKYQQAFSAWSGDLRAGRVKKKSFGPIEHARMTVAIARWKFQERFFPAK